MCNDLLEQNADLQGSSRLLPTQCSILWNDAGCIPLFRSHLVIFQPLSIFVSRRPLLLSFCFNFFRLK